MICEKCGAKHLGSIGSGRFCSRRCSNSRIRTPEIKQKISNSAKTSTKVRQANTARNKKAGNQCPVCNSIFFHSPSTFRIYCSRGCYKKDAVGIYRRKATGGYREGSGRGKNGYYKGIFCASTYELVWVIYRLDHNLPVNRFDGYLQEGKLKYYPDFIEHNTIYEIKGYWTESVDRKILLALNKGYDIKVLYKSDLSDMFDWVSKHYSYVKSLEELYDDSVPKFRYACDYCNKEFFCNKPKRTIRKFCSRWCAGKGHIGRKT